MMKDKHPVFVCGLARSGTTWISESLAQSDELVYIGESWMISKLGELTNWCNYILESYKFDDFTWEKYSSDNNFFVRSIGKFYSDLLYDASGGNRFIEKTPNWNIENIELLCEFFPEAYFVLIYRDGRNQVESYEKFSQKNNQSFDFKQSCENWSLTMEKIDLISKHEHIDKYTLIRYEDLLLKFDETFFELCDFVEINRFRPLSISPNSSFLESEKSHNYNHRWHNWPDKKKFIFKQTAGKQLVQWGYVDTNNSW